MKVIKPHHIFITLLVSFQICFGQEKPKAVLIDNILPINCEDFISRINSVKSPISEDKNLDGYVVIYGEKNNLFRTLVHERWTRAWDFPPYNFTIIRGKEEDKLRVEVWAVPKEDKLPFPPPANWDFSLPELKKPYMFYASDSRGEDALCGSVGQKEHFAEILQANPNFRGHLVIHEKSVKKYLQTKNKLLGEFTNNYKISKNRLKTFFVKEVEVFSSWVEFWIVPQKKSFQKAR